MANETLLTFDTVSNFSWRKGNVLRQSFVGKSEVVAGAIFASVLVTLSGCGSSGSGVGNERSAARVEILEDSYGLSTPSLTYISDNAAFWSLQAAKATSATDNNYKCIFRIDVPAESTSFDPDADRIYSIGQGPFQSFPGSIYIFNGAPSTLKMVESGTVTFSHGKGSSYLTVSFDIVFTDHASIRIPLPRYHLRGKVTTDSRPGEQHLRCDAPGAEEAGEQIYLARCAACHALGDHHKTPERGPDLWQRGAELPLVYPGAVADHKQIVLDEKAQWALRVALNAW